MSTQSTSRQRGPSRFPQTELLEVHIQAHASPHVQIELESKVPATFLMFILELGLWLRKSLAAYQLSW